MTETIVPTNIYNKTKPAPALLQQAARKAVFSLLEQIERGSVILRENGKTLTFGKNTDDHALTASILVHDPRFYTKVLLGGSVGAGEAYMAGFWSTDNLAGLIEIMATNQAARMGVDSGLMRLNQPLHHLFHRLHRNTPKGSRGNILEHYDLGNDFYRLFLDGTMAYSCAFFETDKDSLETAQIAKYDRICDKLQLSSRDHLLEIGTGWGGFAIHAALRAGCRVTTTTISDRQHQKASERIRAAGLSDKVRVLKKDYRKLEGEFDKLVSIEMIEAVGHQYLDTFFKRCSNLLKPEGLMLLQAITIADQYYDQYKQSVDFIKRYIFPGGCLPSIHAMSHSVTRHTDLKMFHLEDITEHYARTLSIWRDRFFKRLDAVRALGFDDVFVRMWDFYLSYCEGGFRSRYIGSVQMLLTKPLWRRRSIMRSI